jgi:hypothetical protein
MSNEQFEDIAVLKTLAQLRRGNLLHRDDQEALLRQLKSDWGRKAATDMLSGNQTEFAESKSVLRRFSSAF